jgi:hypothetical protein
MGTQVYVWEHQGGKADVVHPLWPKDNVTSPTEAEANLRALLMGLRWVEGDR